MLEFTAGPLRLFESTAILNEKFTFVTYMRGKQSDRLYEVDGGSAFPAIEMTPGGFQKIQVTTSSDQSYVKSSLKIQLVPDHEVPQYAYFLIEFPPQVSFEDPYFSQSQCSEWTNFASNTGVCTIFPQNKTIIVSKGFQHGPGGPGELTEFSFVVPFMTNPPTLDQTDSFKFRTTDQFFRTIDVSTQNVTLQMKNPAVLKHASLKIDDRGNGALTPYTFSFVTATAVFKKEFIQIKFPAQCSLPLKEMNCSLVSERGISWPTPCTPNRDSNTLVVRLSAIEDLRPNEAFNLTVDKVMNPNSTYPSDFFEITFFDNASLTRATNKDQGTLFVQTSLPFRIPEAHASFERSNLVAGLPSKYTLRMKLSHSVDAGGGLLIRYPPQLRVEDGSALRVTVDAS